MCLVQGAEAKRQWTKLRFGVRKALFFWAELAVQEEEVKNLLTNAKKGFGCQNI